MLDLRALCKQNLVFSIDVDRVHLHGSACISYFENFVCGGFQITLSNRSGKERFLSLELASNSCLEPSGSQFPEERSPVRLVLLKSMPRLTNCCSIAMPVVVCPPCSSRELALFSDMHLDFLLSLSLSLSLPLFLSLSSLPSLLFGRLSLSLSSLLSSLFSLSLSLSLSLLSLSPSILPFSSLSSYYYYISQLVYLLTINMNSLDFFTVFPYLIQLVHAKNNNNKVEGTKKTKRNGWATPIVKEENHPYLGPTTDLP